MLVINLELRPVDDTDRDEIFEMMRDPEAVRMAAFTAGDPDDREAFNAHHTKIMLSPDISYFGIVLDDRLVGTAATFPIGEDREVTYWIERAFWGRGIASQALCLLIQADPSRPLTARAASQNTRSIAVLRKHGFIEFGRETSFAEAAGGDIEETVFILT